MRLPVSLVLFVLRGRGVDMEEIKKCMRQVKTILPVDCGVLDTSGVILAATDDSLEGETDPSFRAVMSGGDIFASTADRTYLKVNIGEQLKYVIYVESTDADAKISLQLISEWMKIYQEDFAIYHLVGLSSRRIIGILYLQIFVYLVIGAVLGFFLFALLSPYLAALHIGNFYSMDTVLKVIGAVMIFIYICFSVLVLFEYRVVRRRYR